MSAPTTRPVHPCVMSVFDGNTGAEYSTWAYITVRPPQSPNLVTAQASTLRVYTFEEETGKLIVSHLFSDLAGNVCYLATLHAASENSETAQADSLLIGFCGHPRLTIVAVSTPSMASASPTLLMATSLLDLTQALLDASYGSVTPLEEDVVAATMPRKDNEGATCAIILGGGVAVAVLDIQRTSSGWIASEPYLLPLPALHASLRRSHGAKLQLPTAASASAAALAPHSSAVNANVSSISTGFGDILATAFLSGYTEPTIVLLHSNPYHGRTWPGRLGRPHWQLGTRYGLLVTAVSVTVAHQRSAVLWSVEVPADAVALHTVGTTGCLVVCTSSLLFISNAGRIEHYVAANGYARATCPFRLLDQLKPNPKPFPKLSIQLDGAALAFASTDTIFLSLRCGQLYLLQIPTAVNSGGTSMALIPLGKTLGAVGQVANMVAWPLAGAANGLYDKFAAKYTDAVENISMGLLFAGSRMGDSSLLGYAVEGVAMPWMEDDDGDSGKRIKREAEGAAEGDKIPGSTASGTMGVLSSRVSLEEEEILRLEEDALYASISTSEEESDIPDVVPQSDEESVSAVGGAIKRKKLAPSSQVSVVRALTALDSITGLGSLGASCDGPITPCDLLSDEPKIALNPGSASAIGASAHIIPCGYGSSGGLALLTAPGRDERSIIAERDCVDVQCVFSLPKLNLVLLGMTGKNGTGIRVVRLKHDFSPPVMHEEVADVPGTSGQLGISEVDIDEWCKSSDGDSELATSARALFSDAFLLSAAEFDDGSFAMVVSRGIEMTDSSNNTTSIAVLREVSGILEMVACFDLPLTEAYGTLLSIAPMTSVDKDVESPAMMFGVVWSSGAASLIMFSASGIKNCFNLESEATSDPMDDNNAENNNNNDDDETQEFYRSKRIVAVDLFRSPSKLFDNDARDMLRPDSTKNKRQSSSKITPEEPNLTDMEWLLTDDKDLYGVEKSIMPLGVRRSSVELLPEAQESLGDEDLFLGVCRQNGALEIFRVSDFSTAFPVPLWAANGCGLGVPYLSHAGSETRNPQFHQISVNEIRFFFCGPSMTNSSAMNTPTLTRPLCLAIATNTGDFLLYSLDHTSRWSTGIQFNRAPTQIVSRPSQEQMRHHAKLRRKGIIGKSSCPNDTEGSHGEPVFQQNRLHKFYATSGQNGLFAALSRPFWIVSERGKPVALSHRFRHAAPAGGAQRPVAGFCSELDAEGSFLTVHERVGRVGSQRLTIYRGISTMFQEEGFCPGGGFCLEKIPLGVTVRRIQFIDDASAISGGQCLYAVLVSREIEADMSHLNDDGMTVEEREKMDREKEAAKIKRQVEADLGGFDVEQEWVEEIEREDCFQIDKELGGAPPTHQMSYSLWIVDAANRWMVVDSHELGDFELGVTMQVMLLTEFEEEPGSTNASAVESEDLESKLYIVVGTGIVDKNGEDVSSKGRVLVFEVNRNRDASRGSTNPHGVELSFLYEKDIFHGPVTSISCLTSEGKHRLVIGAGADVNVEQWGNGKLTQVGFFRATMQVLDIMLFKNFLVLSDAYDSLYFLIWRDSDKSLTLLAKDYDPIPVYASGVMSRGGALTFLCEDDRQNLQFFQYAPGEAAARGGNKLVCRADFHLGCQTSAFQNYSCRSSLWINSATPTSTIAALKQQDTFFGRTDDDQRLGANFGTSDGGFGAVVPLSEPVYWRLTALQSVITNALESNCALSARAWRLYRRSYRRGGCRNNDRKKGVIDGDLVMKYIDLPMADQEDLASAIGSTVDLILDNLLEIKCASSVM